MENKIGNLQAGLWFGFTCIVAVALAVNGVRALFGLADFAYWHLPTLIIGGYFTWESLPQRFWRRLGVRLKLLWGKAAKAMCFPLSNITRAARGLAALFSTSGNRPQTEP